MFYVYFHMNPITDIVYYVGMGSKSRAYEWAGRKKEHLTWIATLDAIDLEPKVVLVFKTRNRNEAFWAERELIAWHREHGSPLFNVTAGGMGMSGVPLSAETKQKLSATHKAKFMFDPIFRAKRLAAMATARATRYGKPS